MLPIRNTRVLRSGLGILQNVIDSVAAFFLILGGWNATNSNAVFGYLCMALGPVLLYLSFGMWTRGTGKLVGRIVFYGVALLALGLSTAILASVRGLPSVDRWVIYLVIGVLLGTVLSSLAHLRLVRQEVAATK
jgi:hypothetical protein